MTKDSEWKKAWDKANVKMIAAKLFLTKEEDRKIYDFLQAQDSMANTIKLALTEYIANHTPTEYRYGMRLRGFSPGAQPKEVLRREDDTTGTYYDIIVYGRPLSAEEISNYDLDTITTPAKGEKGQGEK